MNHSMKKLWSVILAVVMILGQITPMAALATEVPGYVVYFKAYETDDNEHAIKTLVLGKDVCRVDESAVPTEADITDMPAGMRLVGWTGYPEGTTLENIFADATFVAQFGPVDGQESDGEDDDTVPELINDLIDDVERLMNALPTLEDYKASEDVDADYPTLAADMEAASAALDDLLPDYQLLVSNANRLFDLQQWLVGAPSAEEDVEEGEEELEPETDPAVLEVIGLIAALKAELDAEAIGAARAAYEELDDEQRERVTNLTDLVALEAALTAAQADSAAVEALIAQIDGLISEADLRTLIEAGESDELTEATEQVRASNDAYEALDAELRALVTNRGVLFVLCDLLGIDHEQIEDEMAEIAVDDDRLNVGQVFTVEINGLTEPAYFDLPAGLTADLSAPVNEAASKETPEEAGDPESGAPEVLVVYPNGDEPVQVQLLAASQGEYTLMLSKLEDAEPCSNTVRLYVTSPASRLTLAAYDLNNEPVPYEWDYLNISTFNLELNIKVDVAGTGRSVVLQAPAPLRFVLPNASPEGCKYGMKNANQTLIVLLDDSVADGQLNMQFQMVQAGNSTVADRTALAVAVGRDIYNQNMLSAEPVDPKYEISAIWTENGIPTQDIATFSLHPKIYNTDDVFSRMIYALIHRPYGQNKTYDCATVSEHGYVGNMDRQGWFEWIQDYQLDAPNIHDPLWNLCVSLTIPEGFVVDNPELEAYHAGDNVYIFDHVSELDHYSPNNTSGRVAAENRRLSAIADPFVDGQLFETQGVTMFGARLNLRYDDGQGGHTPLQNGTWYITVNVGYDTRMGHREQTLKMPIETLNYEEVDTPVFNVQYTKTSTTSLYFDIAQGYEGHTAELGQLLSWGVPTNNLYLKQSLHESGQMNWDVGDHVDIKGVSVSGVTYSG